MNINFFIIFINKTENENLNRSITKKIVDIDKF